MWCGWGATKRTWSATLGDQRVQAVDLGVARHTTGTADDEQQRVGPVEGCQRPDGDVGRLQWLDAPHEQQHRRIERQVERASRPVLLAGREERVLHTRSDDLDAAARVAVQPAELVLLLGAVHADRVGAGDDVVLGLVAPLALQVATLGLHLGQRVERGHERQVQLVLQPVGHEPAQEVVGVEDVGGRRGAQVFGHPVAELVEDRRQLLLGEVERAGGDVHDAMAGLHVHHVGLVGVRAAGVGGALHPGLGERRRQLAHVDVHTATVARARLSQRRRVERDDCDSMHDGTKHYRPGRHSRDARGHRD
jgi:hypothetical protein